MSILKGMKKGLPLSIAYFPFAFTLGLIAKNYGVTPFNIFTVNEKKMINTYMGIEMNLKTYTGRIFKI